MPTPRDLVADAVRRLAAAGVESPDHDASELLGFVLGVPRTRLPLTEDIGPAEAAQYDALVARRADAILGAPPPGLNALSAEDLAVLLQILETAVAQD